MLTRGNTLQAQGAAARRAEHVPAVPPGVLAPAHPARRGRERGYDYPKDVPIEELIFVPENAQYYAALRRGALRPLRGRATVGVYTGIDGARRVHHQRPQGAPRRDARARRSSKDERASSTTFREHYTIPKFDAADARARQDVRGVIGLDGGSTSSKAVLIDDETASILKKAYQLSKGNPIQDTKEHARAAARQSSTDQGATLEVMGFGATGYAGRRARGVA